MILLRIFYCLLIEIKHFHIKKFWIKYNLKKKLYFNYYKEDFIRCLYFGKLLINLYHLKRNHYRNI